MLDAALSNRLVPPSNTSHAPPLLVLSDSLLQPALLVLRQLVRSTLEPSPSSSSATAARLVLVCCENDPRRVLPPPGTYDERLVAVVDASVDPTLLPLPLPVLSSSRRTATYASPASLVTDILDALAPLSSEKGEVGEDGPVTVVVDSVNALAGFLGDGHGGEGEAVRVVKRVWEALRRRTSKAGSRVIVVHHDDFPPFPSSSSSFSTTTGPLHPSLLPALLAPTLSPSTAHLTLRPAAHIELLSREYGLPFPSSSDDGDGELDPRTKSFLDSLARRAAGDPFVRPSAHASVDEADERVALDPLGSGTGAGGGGCVVEYEVRGLEVAGGRERGRAAPAPAGRGAPGATAAKKLVRWGLVGARATARVRAEDGSTDVEVREVRLGEVVDRTRMGVRAGVASAASTPPVPSPSTAASTPPPPSSSAAPSAAPPDSGALPFSLSLTPSQRLARSRVSNPFAGADKPIYGEEGYAAPVLPGTAVAAGGIEYTPDRGDDWDDEDPDEDLEL